MKQFKFLSLSIVILMSVSFGALSQKVDVLTMGSTGEFVRPKGASGSKVQEIYMDTAWAVTNLTIEKDKNLQNILTRYELKSNRLEVKTDRGVSVIDAKHIESYTATDKSNKTHNFINGKDFVENGAPLMGMIEVLSEGKKSLYKKYSYYIKKPDYNPALAVGSTDEQLFIEDKLYYNVDKTLIKVPSKKKKLLEVFGDKSMQVKQYIDENKLNTSKESDLPLIFKYYNTL